VAATVTESAYQASFADETTCGLDRYIDIERIGGLLQSLSESAGVATALVDLDGNPLTMAAFTPLCADFHRQHPESAARCAESDSTYAASMVRGKEGALYTCLNGVTCGVAPIVVDGRHLANALIGQFFLDEPDAGRFARQAKRWGFDRDEYLACMKQLPIISETKARAILDVLVVSTQLLADVGSEVLQRQRSEADLLASERRYQSLFEDSPVAMWEEDHSWVKRYVDELVAAGVEDIEAYLLAHPEEQALCLANTKVLSVNRAAVELYGAADEEELIERSDEIDLLLSPVNTRVFWVAMAAGKHAATFETSVKNLAGRDIVLRESCMAAPGHEDTFDRVYIADVDITERKRAEASLVHANRLLRIVSHVNEMIVRQTSVDRLLREACRIFVDTGGFAMAWVGFSSAKDKRVVPVAAAGIDLDVLESFDVRYDESPHGSGPVGTAIRTGRPVVCNDTMVDPMMEPWWDHVRKLGGRSSAAVPIRVGNEIRGVLSVHSPEPASLREGEIDLLQELADDVGFALRALEDAAVREQNEVALRTSEARYRRIVETSIEGIALLDAERRITYANEEISHLTGYELAELQGMPLESMLVPEAGRRQLARYAAGPAGETRRYEVRARRKDGSARWALVSAQPIVDERRQVVGMFAMVTDIHDRKRAEQRAARTLEQLRDSVDAAVRTLARTIEMRDPYTAGHQERVTELTLAIAERLGVPSRTLTSLRIAALIHDLGKIAVPAELLAKPGSLSPMEWELIRQHPATAFDILHDMKFPGPVAAIVRQHHERLDGSGYPYGLRGDEIRRESRILAVADVVEAMASHRPYRPALGVDFALEEIQSRRDVLYDAEAVDACVHLFRDGEFAFS